MSETHSKQQPTVIISIDLELAWGNGKRSLLARHHSERECIKEMLRLFEVYTIPCTWATVGNLLLRDRREMRDTGIELFGNGIYVYNNVLSNSDADETLWFGADIIENILSCKVPQEIGCHTFFHTLAPQIDTDSFQKEIRQMVDLARAKYGITLRSFVFPRNLVDKLDILGDQGLTNYRGTGMASFFHGTLTRYRTLRFVESLCAVPIAPVHSTYATPNRMLNIPESYFLGELLVRSYALPARMKLLRIRRSIDRVLKQGGIFHLWFHPHNIVQMPNGLDTLQQVCEIIQDVREQHGAQVLTMDAFAAQYQSSKP